MRRLMLFVALCAGSLAGCGVVPTLPEPVVRIVEIRVPVPVPCIDAMPARPVIYSLAEILARPNAEAAGLMIEQINVRDGYVGELEALLGACVAQHQ